MRKRIFTIIEIDDGNDKLSTAYDYVMMSTIIISLIPLAFKESNTVFRIIDIVSVAIFIIDYILRFATADLRLGKGAMSFLRYPFTFIAIIDLISILPSFNILRSGFRVLKVFRLLRTFRVFRAIKMFRYSKSLIMIVDVIKAQREPLITVVALAAGYVIISALVVFNVEPDTFDNFFSAVYWATVSLTTMGYGDIYPVTTAGRIVTMLSSFIGIAIVALPAGIITAGFMDKLQNK